MSATNIIAVSGNRLLKNDLPGSKKKKAGGMVLANQVAGLFRLKRLKRIPVNTWSAWAEKSLPQKKYAAAAVGAEGMSTPRSATRPTAGGLTYMPILIAGSHTAEDFNHRRRGEPHGDGSAYH